MENIFTYKTKILFEDEYNFNIQFSKLSKKINSFGGQLEVLKSPGIYKDKSTNKEYSAINLEFICSSPVIVYKDYKYVATLKKSISDEKDNSIFNNKKNRDFSDYFKVDFRCDHCKTNRRRLKVHIFENDNGNQLMIASTCAKEYFGIGIVKMISQLFKMEDLCLKIQDDFPDPDTETISVKNAFDTEKYAKISYYIIKSEGKYISCEKAKTDYTQPTKKRVDSAINNGIDASENFKEITRNFKFKNVIDYWNNKKDNSDFTHNIQTSLKQYRPYRGMVVYAVYEYMKNVEKIWEPSQPKQIKNEFVGVVGSKINIECINNITLTKHQGNKFYYKDSGIYFIITFFDEKFRKFSWITNNHPNVDVTTIKSIKGTIKKHNDFRGVKTTQLTRCKVITE